MTEGIAVPGTPAYDKILDQMVAREHEADMGLRSPLWRMATVVAVSNTDPSCSIYLGGDTDTQIDGVKFLHTYRPRVNDVVWLMQNGSDKIIVGTTTLPPAQRFFTAQSDGDAYTTSTSYVSTLTGNPSDPTGPQIADIWLYSGQEIWVDLNCKMFSITDSPAAVGLMSFKMSGASSLTTFDTNAVWAEQFSSHGPDSASRCTRVTAGATGLHTFTAWYRKSIGSGGDVHFYRRRMNITVG